MKVNIPRTSAYLAGNMAPYYEAHSKIEFILICQRFAPSVLSSDRFDLIERHTHSLQEFFHSSLLLLKDHSDALAMIAIELELPLEFVELTLRERLADALRAILRN